MEKMCSGTGAVVTGCGKLKVTVAGKRWQLAHWKNVFGDYCIYDSRLARVTVSTAADKSHYTYLFVVTPKVNK